jgi:hypothetical protein
MAGRQPSRAEAGIAVLNIQPLSLADALFVFSQAGPAHGLAPPDWEGFCRARGLLAFAVTDGDLLAGLAVAESTPRLLHIPYLDGSRTACRLLLKRLVLLAGERDVSLSCRAERVDLRQLLEQRGFGLLCEENLKGTALCLYGLDRNPDDEHP